MNIAAGDSVHISVVPSAETGNDRILKMSTLNKDLLAKAFDISISVNGQNITSFQAPIVLKMDLSEFEITNYQKSKLTGVRFLTGGEVKHLGGKLHGNTFEFSTQSLSRYGVIISDDMVRIITTIGNTRHMVNGVNKNTDAAPTIISDRTMVPVRFIAESLGADVNWTEATQTIDISLDGKDVSLTIGRKSQGMDVAPVMVDGRTLVPLSFVSQQLGATVDWDDASRSVEIIK